MSGLTVPIVTTVIGEGGSGGALALGVADRVLMFEHATYSVISPEGCAAILWDNSSKAYEAADLLKITAQDLFQMKVIDEMIEEPIGGAHRDPQATAQTLRKALAEALKQVQGKKPKELVEERLERLMGHGKYKEVVER